MDLSAGLGSAGTLDTAVSFPWKQLGVIAASSSGRKVLSADSEVWEWDRESGEELDLLVFNLMSH